MINSDKELVLKVNRAIDRCEFEGIQHISGWEYLKACERLKKVMSREEFIKLMNSGS